MALYFAEGWQGYSDSSDFTDRGWTLTNSSFITLDATGGRWSDATLKLTAQSTGGLPRLSKNTMVSMSGTLVRIAFWVKTTSIFVANGLFTSSSYLVSLEDATPASWLDVAIAPTGIIAVSRSESARSATKDYVMYSMTKVTDGNWHHVEVEVSLNNTTGSGKLWIDGRLEHSIINTDTIDAATNISTYTRVTLAANRLSNTAGHEVWLGPVLVWDDSGTDFTGELANHTHRIVGLYPDGAGASSNFAPSAGSNFQNVDENNPDGDTTYNSSTTAGHKDSFNYGNLPTSTSSVLGVVVSTIARSVTNTPTFRSYTRISGTDYIGGTKTLGTSYANFDQIFEDSPATGNDWTLSEVDAAEFGYEAVSGTDEVRVTRHFVEAIIQETGTDTLRVTRNFIEVLYKAGAAPSGGSSTITTVVVCA